jgi:hypothetical protein
MYGCRCDVCRAYARQLQETRAARRREREAIEHGTTDGYTNGGCRCSSCRHAFSLLNAQTRDHAVHHGDPWTKVELDYILATDEAGRYLRTARDAAAALGRTWFAVRQQRQIAKRDPRKAGLV